MLNRQSISQALLLTGLGGALASSSIIAGTTLLLAIVGGYLIKQQTLIKEGWEVPKELRLIHFAFWFFVVTSVASWIAEGFEYEGGKTLGAHARLILFWPLAIALIGAKVNARTIFAAYMVSCGVICLLFLTELAGNSWSLTTTLRQRFGPGINPIHFGNLALLSALLAAAGAFFFHSQRQKTLSVLAILLGIGALAVALMSQTRSNLIALPALLPFFALLIPGRKKILAIAVLGAIAFTAVFNSERFTDSLEAVLEGKIDNSLEMRIEAWQLAWNQFLENPVMGSGLSGYHEAASRHEDDTFLACCTDHAHNDLLQQAATKGITGILSWLFLLAIPFAIFIRQTRNQNRTVSILATAGALVPSGYLVFGLTEAAFDRSLFLTYYLVSIAAISAAMLHELELSYTRKRKRKVSATIITKNEEDHIAACLSSVRPIADEIIVLDSGSTDKTVEIARQYADIVEITDWPGFGIQKQRALELASGDWVLSIDADERVSPALAREINHTLSDPDADAYRLPWAVTLYGKRLDFGRSGRAPLRLFRREGVRFSSAMVHEKILVPEDRKIRSMRGRLTHFTHRNFGHALEKSAKYAWLGSQEKFRKGKRTRFLVYPTLRGLMTFLQVYVFRLGFLDGSVGFLVAVTYAQGSFNKYAGLWTLTRTERQKSRE
ncbi:glycosyltransferase [Marinobacter orientalis]|uniref:Glycosyltransferase n=1 Tax=Marinobacter orientalis TaxID=1928859 RepID=A0A7Y0RFJ8_9GAMM|nr:glycosyltransferase [Marinobacter orientalis]NMT65293.1 glycosyltransferase [Marinobacter orientalis]TGX47935.1 glycosyltransferase [Marinobacter orientalis]